MNYLVVLLTLMIALLIWLTIRLSRLEDEVEAMAEKMLEHNDAIDFFDEELDNVHVDIREIRREIYTPNPPS